MIIPSARSSAAAAGSRSIENHHRCRRVFTGGARVRPAGSGGGGAPIDIHPLPLSPYTIVRVYV